MENWLSVCSVLQCLDCHKRAARVHVEHESEQWQEAANLILEIESVSTNFISHALLDSSASSLNSPSESKSIHGAATSDLMTLRKEACEQSLRVALMTVKAWIESSNYTWDESALNLLVNSQAVSAHLPLNRFIAKVILYSCYGSLQLTEALQILYEADEIVKVSLLDFAMRSISFICQVAAGAWRRNGYSVRCK